MSLVLIPVACVLLAALSLSAGARPPQQAESVDEVIADALFGLYSLDFDDAEAKLQSLTEREPDSPRAWNLLASSIWLKLVYEQEKLNLDSFSGSQLGGDGSNDLINEERESRLREVLARAISVAEVRLETDPDDIEALYAIGVAYGTIASFEATVKRAYLAANSAAGKAREAHMQVLNLDPSYNEARLTIGTYSYAVGVLPWPVRALIGMFGIRGDKEGGIEQLQFAAELGENNGTNAKMVLVVVYNREKEYDHSLSILKDLHSMYPRNFLLEVSSAYVYQRLEDWDAAVAVYESVLGKVRTGEDDYDRLEPEPVLFKIGEAHIRRMDADSALEAFDAIVDSPDSADELKARSHLWMGKIFDTQGARPRALEEYAQVLELEAPQEIHDEANRFTRQPYNGE
jgi:tetratricopeptide (TPR) repeat protein